MTLSSTERSRNNWMFWNVRVTPSAAIECGGSAFIGTSPSRTTPPVGR